MTDSDEKLSCLVDDYLVDDGGSTLDEVLGDVNLQYRLRRFRMIGEVMRGELPRAIDTGFHSRVMARIRTQDVVSRGATRRQKSTETVRRFPILGWARLKPAAGLAVAATVAMVTIAVWKPLERETAQPGDALVRADQHKIQKLAGQQPEGDVVPASGSLQPLGTRWKIDREMPGMQQKLNAYLVNHTEYSNSVQGLIPQARVAGFDAQQ